MTRPKICLYCGSRTGNDPAYAKLAEEFGQKLVTEGYDLVYGGGKVGLMGIAAQAVLKAGGHVTGIIPGGLFDREVAAEDVSDLRVVKTMHERKALMETLSDGFVAIPGGWGTLDELFEILTWKQIGIHNKPIGILNWNGFFDPIITQMDLMLEAGFVNADHRSLFVIASDVGSLFELMDVPR